MNDGRFVRATIVGTDGLLARSHIVTHASRDETVSEVTSWAFGWIGRAHNEGCRTGTGHRDSNEV